MSAEAVGVRSDPVTYVVRGTHRTLVPQVGEDPVLSRRIGAPIDGVVVVPASRKDPLLETPARIAADLGWPLVLLCSHHSKARRLLAGVREAWPSVDVTAADLLHDDLLRAHDEWLTDEHPAARQRLDIDTNRKRNLGLAAARMTGRSWVLFVDDDVLRLSTRHVVRASEHLTVTGQKIVSWPLEWFPDNSVVHHARRDFLGLYQDVFLGGAALLVRLDGWTPPGFPPIYNEDWLFLFDPIGDGDVASGPDVGQLTVRPYARPERARDEEFGDVLGEGLYHLLHERLPIDLALGAEYWRSVHDKRTKLIQRTLVELRTRLLHATHEEERRHLVQALDAIDEARKQLTRATPGSLADFVSRWRRDEALWRSFLAKLPARDSLKEALVYLGLQDWWIVAS